MTNPDEPADGSYVAVQYRRPEGFGVYRRLDEFAEHNCLGEAHWFNRNNMNEPALTWIGVTDLGEVAYVGQFVDRRLA
jgi:hypothetical protein